MSPFIVLNIPVTASDADVRTAYQALLREHTPEQSPEQFQRIQAAYNQVKTERARWRAHVLARPIPGDNPLDVLAQFAALPKRQNPPGAPAFRSYLRSCVEAAAKAKK